jgi:hypothetical protein
MENMSSSLLQCFRWASVALFVSFVLLHCLLYGAEKQMPGGASGGSCGFAFGLFVGCLGCFFGQLFVFQSSNFAAIKGTNLIVLCSFVFSFCLFV